jgi:peptidoglycan-associated lipoprotein
MMAVGSRSVALLSVFLVLALSACHKAVPPQPIAATSTPPPLPPSVSLSADRTTITAGQTVTLSWQSTNATVVLLDNSIGNVAPTGSRQISPQTSTSYSATAQGPGGRATSASVRINVNVPPATVARQSASPSPSPVRSPSLAEQFQSNMQSVLFDYDRATIREGETVKLEAGARWLRDNVDVRFTIEGNADERGSQEYNVALGDERAAAVKKYLSARGIPESRMTTISYGEEKPACREENESCWQRNRRAQFVIRP